MKTRYFSIFLAFALLVVSCQISIAQKQLYVLHSSDTHSRIDPIDAKQSTRNANMGGVARRAGFVNQFRQQTVDIALGRAIRQAGLRTLSGETVLQLGHGQVQLLRGDAHVQFATAGMDKVTKP